MSLLAAIGIGAATAAGADLGGPLALTGLGLVESLLGLVSLDMAAQAAATLAGPSGRW